MKVDVFDNLPVLSIGTGAKLGYVDDLLFDTSPFRVAALRVKAEGQQVVFCSVVIATPNRPENRS